MIDPSVRAVLRSRYTIRRFFWLFGAMLALALALLGLLIETLNASSPFRAAGTEFLGHFAADDAVFLLVYCFYLRLTPPGLRDAQVLPLRSGEIADGIVDLPVGATDYWFSGRSGSYFRSVVLPKLDKAARTERRHITIRVVLPDPLNGANAHRYALMKRGLGEEANEHTLGANVVATVIATVRAAVQNPYLHATIAFSPTVPVLRYDISNVGALLSRDAISLPALLVNAHNPYFDMFRDAVENDLAQSRPITWESSSPALSDGADVSVEAALVAIDGLAGLDQPVKAAAEALLAAKTHRYHPVTVFSAARTRLRRTVHDAG
jgi:hypothetical protein